MLIEREPTTVSLSHAAGPRDVPLLEITIGENLRRTVERFGDREALVVRQQGYRATYRELWDAGRARRARPARPRRAARATASASGRPTATSGSSSSTRPRASAPSSSTSTRPTRPPSCEYALDQVRRQPAGPGARLPPGRLRRDARRGARRVPGAARGARPRRRLGRRCWPTARRVVRRRAGRARGDARSSTTRSTSSTPRAPPASPRARRSRTTTSSTTATSSGESCATPSDDRVCIPVPFYHCFGMVLGNLACIAHGACMVVPGESFDPLAVAARPSRPSAAPRSTACRRCSSPSSSIRASATSTSRPCAPASWPARRARSR